MYPMTTSMLPRVMADRGLPPGCRSRILALGEWVHDDLKTFIGMDADLAAGFCQHYEYPTRFLDFTSSPNVAAYFASQGKVGDAGLMCVLPVRKASTMTKIIDLTHHPKAERPRRQHAYVLSSPGFYDLKAQATIDVTGIEWLEFKLTAQDKADFAEDKHLLDANSDAVAGVLQLSINSYGKIDDWSAKWLSEHVVPAPFIAKLDSGTGEVVLVSASDACVEFDETIEQFNNYRCWSSQYPDTRGRGGFENLWPKR